MPEMMDLAKLPSSYESMHMSARLPVYQARLVETSQPAAAPTWLVISNQTAAL